MSKLELKPTHKPVQNYHAVLRQFDGLGVSHQDAVKSAFRSLSASIVEWARVRGRSVSGARKFNWKLVPEYASKRNGQADDLALMPKLAASARNS